MNHEMNSLLEAMRSHLVSHLTEGEEAWGPDSQVRSTGGGTPGSSGAENSSNVWDAFDLFVGEIVDDLLEEYEGDEESMLDFVLEIADELAAAGRMPPVPSDEDDPQAVARWLGVAGTMGFERAVLDAAAEAAED